MLIKQLQCSLILESRLFLASAFWVALLVSFQWPLVMLLRRLRCGLIVFSVYLMLLKCSPRQLTLLFPDLCNLSNIFAISDS